MNRSVTETKFRNVAFIGNPNTGKSTIFSALAGIATRIGNFPGVTVEKKIGVAQWNGRDIRLIDLPGTYSLSPRTKDEMVAVDVLVGAQDEIGDIDLVVCIVDSTNIERNLYLVSQLMDVGTPMIVVLNMWDAATAKGIQIDVDKLSQRLGVPVVTTEAHRRVGLDKLRDLIAGEELPAIPQAPRIFPAEFYGECDSLGGRLDELGITNTNDYLIERLLLDSGGYTEQRFSEAGDLTAHLTSARERLKDAKCAVPAIEARVRYAWIRESLADVVEKPDSNHEVSTTSDKLDSFLTHRVTGLLFFCALMFVVFQSIYQWSGPLMDLIETVQGFASGVVEQAMLAGPLRSLLVDGVIAGVGSVLVFLPQIAFLFFFIAILEDCGYMARAAFLMDRLMTCVGLSGKSFVPLMSSFACAIPGVMAARVIENRRDRMVTILVAPLMSCSARLPVYMLLIGAFVPPTTYLGGWLGTQGVVLFCMMSVGAVVAIPIAWLLKKFVFPGETPPFVMELPQYKIPSIRIVVMRVFDRCKAFVMRAGSLIFMTTVLVWAAGSFPGDRTEYFEVQNRIEKIQASEVDDEELESLEQQKKEIASRLLESSVLGMSGKAVEPIVRPLGWDWKLGIGAIASFPAREVIIATLGTIYSLGADAEESGLVAAMNAAKWPDGRPVYNLPVALSVMVFFALCAQCGATIMVIKRETASWYWALFTFFYMTALAYVFALLTYQIGRAFL